MRIAGRVTTHQPAQMYLFKDGIYPDMETKRCLSKSEKKVLHFLVKFGKYVQICNMHSRCKIKIGSNFLQDWSVWFSWIKHGLSVLFWFGSARSGQFCQYYGGCHNTIICHYMHIYGDSKISQSKFAAEKDSGSTGSPHWRIEVHLRKLGIFRNGLIITYQLGLCERMQVLSENKTVGSVLEML